MFISIEWNVYNDNSGRGSGNGSSSGSASGGIEVVVVLEEVV